MENKEFDNWWFSNQFAREYWRKHKHEHQLEYNWAKLAWKAALNQVKGEQDNES